MTAVGPSLTAQAAAPERAGTRVLVVGGSAPGSCRAASELEPRGFQVAQVRELLPDLSLEGVDAIVFALPPSEDDRAVSWCAQLRGRTAAGLVVLYQGDDTSYVVRALESGADDCMARPHNPRELVARVKAVLRRRTRIATRYGGRHWVFDGHQLDCVRLLVRAPDGRQVNITPGQGRLLTALLSRPGEVLDREQLLDQMVGEDAEAFPQAIDVQISRLRKRLAAVSNADLICNYRGVGYRLNVRRVVQ